MRLLTDPRMPWSRAESLGMGAAVKFYFAEYLFVRPLKIICFEDSSGEHGRDANLLILPAISVRPMTLTELLESVRRVEVRTNRLVNDTMVGAYLSHFKGRGMDFEELREYIPGDDVRDIDWNVTHRLGRVFVKRFREERELTAVLAVDVSASSRFGSANRTKREFAAEIAATLALSAAKNGDKVALLLFTDEVELFVPPRKGRRHILRLVRELLTFSAAQTRHGHFPRARIFESCFAPPRDCFSADGFFAFGEKGSSSSFLLVLVLEIVCSKFRGRGTRTRTRRIKFARCHRRTRPHEHAPRCRLPASARPARKRTAGRRPRDHRRRRDRRTAGTRFHARQCAPAVRRRKRRAAGGTGSRLESHRRGHAAAEHRRTVRARAATVL